MSKLKFQCNEEEVEVKYLQNNSAVICSVLRLTQSNQVEARQGLLIDFNVCDSADQQRRSGALEHKLRSIFTSVVVSKLIPNCQMKVNIFVLMKSVEIEAAIINACWCAFLKMGVPMNRSIWAWCQKESNTIVVSMEKPYEILYGKYYEAPNQSILKDMLGYKQLLIQKFHESLQ